MEPSDHDQLILQSLAKQTAKLSDSTQTAKHYAYFPYLRENFQPMNYQIRNAEPSDFDAIFNLISQLAAFEQAADQVSNSVNQMLQEKDYFQALVVESDSKQIIGFALFFFAYYTWVGKSLYLDDLFVLPEYRSNGIGKALLSELQSIARTENCKRIRWQVLDWNTPAIEFYKSLGATISGNWLNCDGKL